MLGIFKKKPVKTVIIAAGGTGGHIIPALMIANVFLTKKCNVCFITDRRFDNYAGSFKKICNNKNFHIKYLNMDFKGNWITQKIRRFLYAFWAICLVMKIITKNKPSATIGFGSYVSLPTICASWIMRVKSFLHEQNSHMGMANRISMLFVKVAMLSFPETSGIPWVFKYKAIVTGFPLRPEVKKMHYQNVIETINYDVFFKIKDLINIVVIGGSQGAASFQEIIPQAIAGLEKETKAIIRVAHQAPKSDVVKTHEFYKKNKIKADVSHFFDNAPELMSQAHVLISRSGAGTVFEIMALGTPSILIPYPFAAHNHQLKNALFLQNNGAAIVVEQSKLTSQKICDILNRLFTDYTSMAHLSSAAKQIADINADIKIIQAVEAITGQLGSKTPDIDIRGNAVIATNVSMG